MKKVLILAYDFPPYYSVGAKRPFGWFKSLKKSDIYPIVITRDWTNNDLNIDYVSSSKDKRGFVEENDNGTIIHCPYKANLRDRLILKYGFSKFKFLRRFLTFFYSTIQFISFRFDNKSTIFNESVKFLKQEKVDLIIATGEPFILFRYANKLSKMYNIPWVSDYRDGWNLNYQYEYKSNFETIFLKWLYKYIEKKIVKTSEYAITVSEPLAERTESFIGKKTYVIRNGFERDAFQNLKLSENNKSDIFKIAYSGYIYPYQRIDIFAKGFKIFLKNYPNAKINIIFYGTLNNPMQEALISKYFAELKDLVISTKRLEYSNLIKELNDTNLLLLLANEKIDGSCTKIYDYLALRKKILLSVNDNSTLEKIIKETSSGEIAENEKDVFQILKNSYLEWLQKGYVECFTQEYEVYSRESQTRELSKILSQTINDYNNIHKRCINCGSFKISYITKFYFEDISKCKDCGFVFSTKAPTKEELDLCYAEYGEGNYYSPVTIKRYNEILDSFELYKKGGNLLDIGCGKGQFLAIAKERGWEVFGTEYSQKLINEGNKNGFKVFSPKQASENFKPNSFDVITLFEVIEHVIHPDEIMSLVREVLRPGGIVYLTTPNFNSISKLIVGKKWNIVQYPEHLLFFTSRHIGLLFEKHGFKKKRIQTTGISISRIQRSTELNLDNTLKDDSHDEKLRNFLEKSMFAKFLKNSLNKVLSVFKIGDTIKAIYIKSEQND